MKKLGIIFAVLLLAISMVHAVKDTYINGMVYSGDGISSPVVNNTEVIVTCNTNTLNDVTGMGGVDGKYEVLFQDNTCPFGATVHSCVGTKCSQDFIVDSELEQVNINGVDIFNVPEFGIATAMLALVGATLMFVVIRKRN